MRGKQRSGGRRALFAILCAAGMVVPAWSNGLAAPVENPAETVSSEIEVIELESEDPGKEAPLSPESIPVNTDVPGFAGAGILMLPENLVSEWPRAMVVTEGGYLKAGPSETAETMPVLLYTGMTVECEGQEGDWIRVVYADQTGYVPASSLREETLGAQPSGNRGNGLLVAIDPGHQAHQNSEQEPVGPGSSETKMKVSSGTDGDYTGVPEYKLTLEVSLKLRDELEARGYEVLMIRTTNDVNISNVERAQMANDAGADAFLRIHADGSDSHSARGCMTICQTPGNPWNGEIYPECRALAEAVLEGMVEETGAKDRGVYESDTYSGINWCTVPVTIVEMGFMSNEEEDRLLQTAEYQNLMVQGMANGLDAFFGYPEVRPLETEAETEEFWLPETETSGTEGELPAENAGITAAETEAPANAGQNSGTEVPANAGQSSGTEVPANAGQSSGTEVPVTTEGTPGTGAESVPPQTSGAAGIEIREDQASQGASRSEGMPQGAADGTSSPETPAGETTEGSADQASSLG